MVCEETPGRGPGTDVGLSKGPRFCWRMKRRLSWDGSMGRSGQGVEERENSCSLLVCNCLREERRRRLSERLLLSLIKPYLQLEEK